MFWSTTSPAFTIIITRRGDYSAGVMVTASHNPAADNGIKVFGGDGFKLPDDAESEIDEGWLTDVETVGVTSGASAPEKLVERVCAVGAGLLLSSFYRLQRVDPGYRADRVLSAEAFTNFSKYPTPDIIVDHIGDLARTNIAGWFPLPGPSHEQDHAATP